MQDSSIAKKGIAKIITHLLGGRFTSELGRNDFCCGNAVDPRCRGHDTAAPRASRYIYTCCLRVTLASYPTIVVPFQLARTRVQSRQGHDESPERQKPHTTLPVEFKRSPSCTSCHTEWGNLSASCDRYSFLHFMGFYAYYHARMFAVTVRSNPGQKKQQ